VNPPVVTPPTSGGPDNGREIPTGTPTTSINTAGLITTGSAGTQAGTVVAAGVTKGAPTTAVSTAVGGPSVLAKTGLNETFVLWAGAMLLMGLFLAAAGRRKAAANRR